MNSYKALCAFTDRAPISNPTEEYRHRVLDAARRLCDAAREQIADEEKALCKLRMKQGADDARTAD
jgi:hypothetical protein